jgi:hypothetical protein
MALEIEIEIAIFQIPRAMIIMIILFWNVRPCSLVNIYQLIPRNCCFHFYPEESGSKLLRNVYINYTQRQILEELYCSLLGDDVV